MVGLGPQRGSPPPSPTTPKIVEHPLGPSPSREQLPCMHPQLGPPNGAYWPWRVLFLGLIALRWAKLAWSIAAIVHRFGPRWHCTFFFCVDPQTDEGGKLVQPQHAAACRSMPQHLFFGAAHGGFEACRSMPQRAKIFTWRTFFFITCQTCEPCVAQMPQNWMVAQWSTYQVPRSWVLGSIPGKGNVLPISSSLLLHRSSLFWCIGKVLGTTSAFLPCLSAPIEV